MEIMTEVLEAYKEGRIPPLVDALFDHLRAREETTFDI